MNDHVDDHDHGAGDHHVDHHHHGVDDHHDKHLFLCWTGDCGGASPTCTFTIVGDASVGAVFD